MFLCGYLTLSLPILMLTSPASEAAPAQDKVHKRVPRSDTSSINFYNHKDRDLSDLGSLARLDLGPNTEEILNSLVLSDPRLLREQDNILAKLMSTLDGLREIKHRGDHIRMTKRRRNYFTN